MLLGSDDLVHRSPVLRSRDLMDNSTTPRRTKSAASDDVPPVSYHEDFNCKDLKTNSLVRFWHLWEITNGGTAISATERGEAPTQEATHAQPGRGA